MPPVASAVLARWGARASAKNIAEGYKEMKTRMLALLTILGLVVAACGGSTAESPSASVDAGKGDYKACLALDVLSLIHI